MPVSTIHDSPAVTEPVDRSGSVSASLAEPLDTAVAIPLRSDSRRWRSRAVLLLKIAAAAGIMAWLVQSGRFDVGRLAAISFSSDLAILAALVFASMLLPAVRWWWLLRAQRLSVSLWRATVLTWVGYAAALVLPGAASGDLAKGYYLVRQQPRARARALSTVLVDRFIGLYSLLLLGVLSAAGIALSNQASPALQATAATLTALFAVATLATAWILIAPPRRLLARVLPTTWLTAWKESYCLYGQSKGILAGCLALSLASSVLTAAALAAADHVLGGTISWAASLIVGPPVALANCIPLTPGGVGIAEAGASEMFDQLASPHGAEAMMLMRLFIAIASIPGFEALTRSIGAYSRTATCSARCETLQQAQS